MRKYIALICLALVLVFPAYVSSDQDTSFAQTPVIFVSAGQSGGSIHTIEAICDMAGLKYDLTDAPTDKHLASGVGFSAYDQSKDNHIYYVKGYDMPNGTKYETLVLVMGCSLFGSHSYPPIEPEFSRIKSNIIWAKANGVTIIGMHVEGASMRNKPGSYNERIIDLVAPQCDMLIVVASSNQDGKFTNIAEANNIPIEIAPNGRALIPIIQKVFGL